MKQSIVENMDYLKAKFKEISARMKAAGWYPYLQIGDGWAELAVETHDKLLDLDPNYTPCQIKEKFGAMRFYFDPSEDVDDDTYNKMKAIAFDAEDRSAKICEHCGEDGEPRSVNGWWYTSCEEHIRG